MERQLIFNSALKLVKEGKFLGSRMSDIAYHAHLTELTTSYFFQTSDTLVSELASHITQELTSVVAKAAVADAPFEEQFVSTWLSVYHFYLKQPGVMTFVEQADTLSSICEEKITETMLIAPLVTFFRNAPEALRQNFRPETLASVFHGSIVTAVKLKEAKASSGDEEIRTLPLVLWRGINETQGAVI